MTSEQPDESATFRDPFTGVRIDPHQESTWRPLNEGLNSPPPSGLPQFTQPSWDEAASQAAVDELTRLGQELRLPERWED